MAGAAGQHRGPPTSTTSFPFNLNLEAYFQLPPSLRRALTPVKYYSVLCEGLLRHDRARRIDVTSVRNVATSKNGSLEESVHMSAFKPNNPECRQFLCPHCTRARTCYVVCDESETETDTFAPITQRAVAGRPPVDDALPQRPLPRRPTCLKTAAGLELCES